MKKLFISYIFFSFVVTLFSQINITSKYISIPNQAGLDDIYIFEKIDNTSEIHYTTNDAAKVIKWYKFLNGVKTEITTFSVLSSTETYIDPINNTGYIIEENGVKKASFWVFDYAVYKPTFNSITASQGTSMCEEVKLTVDGNIPLFEYQNIYGAKFTLDRKFTVTYKSIVWENNKWSDLKNNSLTIILPNAAGVNVPASLVDTHYEISGDEFGVQLNATQTASTLQEYEAKAVQCNITSITSTVRKDIENENNRPKSEDQLNGSAPMDINFFSNPTPKVNTYLWEIYNVLSPSSVVSRSEKDNSYTFSDAGKYKVILKVSNQYCSYADTLDVEVVESMLFAPKVFTPNGDEVQDEYRVAYQSIVEFNGVIFNRWGRKVFSWTNPAKGWDGNIGGRPAAIGPYYYIITAKGSEGKRYKLKGYLNLLR